jgi:hypothetical protein
MVEWNEGKTLRYSKWLERVEKWAGKFSFELTLDQAVEIILDDSDWDDFIEDFSDINLKDVCSSCEWNEFANHRRYRECN